MKLLLTSAGIKNPSINDALVDLLGKADRRIGRPVHPHRRLRAPPGQSRWGMAVHHRTSQPRPCASWVGSPWACWS